MALDPRLFYEVFPDNAASGYFAAPGVYDAAAGKSKPGRRVYCATVSDLDALVRACAARNQDCWVATDGFVPNAKEGKAVFVNAVRSFKLDIDVDAKDPNKYPDKATALAALDAHVSSGALPEPTHVNDSGNGLHVFWAMDNALHPTDYQVSSKHFVRALVALDAKLAADTSRSSDLAGLLRFPGGVNAKNRMNILPVQLLRHSQPYDTQSLVDFIHAMPAPAATPKPRSLRKIGAPATVVPIKSLLVPDAANRTSNVADIMKCAILRDFVAKASAAHRAGSPIDLPYNHGRWLFARILAFAIRGAEFATRLLALLAPQFRDPLDALTTRMAQQDNIKPPYCTTLQEQFYDPATGKPYGDSLCQVCPAYRKCKNTVTPVNLGDYFAAIDQGAVTAAVAETLFPPVEFDEMLADMPGAIRACDAATPTPNAKGYWMTREGEFVYADVTKVKPSEKDYPEEKDSSTIEIYRLTTRPFWLSHRSPIAGNENENGYVMATVLPHDYLSLAAGDPRPVALRQLEAPPLSSFQIFQRALEEARITFIYDDKEEVTRKLVKSFLSDNNRRLAFDPATALVAHGGYTDDMQSFNCGLLNISAQGYSQVLTPARDYQADCRAYHRAGDFQAQLSLVNAIWAAACDDARMLLVAGLCAPLGRILDNGATNFLFNLTAPPGVGKSPILRAAAGFWGNPALQISNPQNTAKSNEPKLGKAGNIPFFFDEVSRQNAEKIDSIVWMINHGQGGDRMESSSNRNRENNNRFQTTLVSTSNVPVRVTLKDLPDNEGTDATLRRMLECRRNDKTKLLAVDQTTATRFEEVSKDNFGFLGPRFVQFILQNKDAVRARMQKHIEYYAKKFPRSEFSFMITAVAMLATAEEIGQRLGYWTMMDRRIDQWNNLLKRQEGMKIDPEKDRSNKFVLGLLATIPPAQQVHVVRSGTGFSPLTSGGWAESGDTRIPVLMRTEHTLGPGVAGNKRRVFVSEKLARRHAEDMKFTFSAVLQEAYASRIFLGSTSAKRMLEGFESKMAAGNPALHDRTPCLVFSLD